MTDLQNDARDGWCPKCRAYRELIWNQIDTATTQADGQMTTFKGLSMRCRICDFEITKVGRVGPTINLVSQP